MKRITAILAAMTMTLAMSAQENQELTTAEAKALYKSTSKRHVTVHDPSVVWEPSTKRYYIFGSHKAGAYTSDLQNWTTSNPTWKTATATNVANNRAFVTPEVKKIKKGGEEVDFINFNAMEWSARTDAGYNVDGNMWAPDVIWNEQMQKWCMYLSINGDAWHSSIILLTADRVTGPYLYQGPVVICGFQDSGHSYKDTDLELVIGEQKSLPTRYNVGGNWGRRWPHTIDPAVFYDEDGKLWLVYGSWSGGIWMLELDEATGLRDYNVSYPSTNGNSDGVTSDPYFGKKVAGGFYVSGEGPYIEHIGNYYYLFVSYGFFDSVGGYVMRVFRSVKPDGPYRDASGRSAIFSNYAMNYGNNADNRGVKIMGAYSDWGFMQQGELSQGHNSIIAAQDGRTYLVYHTRFNSGNEGHQVRVHQVFQTKNGWLVASPFEYNGEQLTDTDIATRSLYTTDEIIGTYQLLNHKYGMDYKNREVVTPVKVTLHADGTVSGAYSGTWAVEEGTSYLTLKLGSTTYNGVLFQQQMDDQSIKSISFSALSAGGINVWGYKMEPKYELAWQLNHQKVPVANNTTVNKDVDLYGMDQHMDNTLFSLSSDQPDIISPYGKYNPTGLTDDTPVTLTVRAQTNNYYWQQSYNVIAAKETALTADWQTGLLAHYGFDDDALANTFNRNEQAELKRNSTTKLPTLADDEPLRTGSYVHLNAGENGKESFVAVPNPLYGKDLSNGATISFWVKRTDANLWDALFALVNGEARLYMTGNLYVGFNDNNGKWLDINHPNRVKPSNLTVGKWHLVTITFEQKATSTTGGVTFYIDGTKRSGDNFNGSIDGTSVTSKSAFDYSLLLSHLAACPTLCLGNGSFWGSPDASFDDLLIYDRALAMAEVAALNLMENRVFDFHSLPTGIAELKTDASPASTAVYTLTGINVGNTTQGLPRGIYVVGGKKVFVK